MKCAYSGRTSALLSVRCWRYAMPFQDILDRVRCNDVNEIAESAFDSIVAPGDILPRHAEYQIADLLRGAGSTRSRPGIGPLLRDKLTVPGEQRIGCHQRLQFIKCPATKHLGLHGQSYPLFVGEAKPLPFELLLEHTVLLYKIVDHCLLHRVTRRCHHRPVP